MTFTITMTTIKWATAVFLILSTISLFYGDLPDHEGHPVANGLRWIAWDLSCAWQP